MVKVNGEGSNIYNNMRLYKEQFIKNYRVNYSVICELEIVKLYENLTKLYFIIKICPH
jgi:hypothetical protein